MRFQHAHDTQHFDNTLMLREMCFVCSELERTARLVWLNTVVILLYDVPDHFECTWVFCFCCHQSVTSRNCMNLSELRNT